MIVTIIGSLSKADRIKEVRKHLEKMGNIVNAPIDPELQKLPLVQIQMKWIEKIKEADIIIAIPKSVEGKTNGSGEISYMFGESTSYEMAIAAEFNKPVFIVS